MAKAMTVAAGVLDASAFSRAAGRGLKFGIQSIQVAQMMAVLGQMSDHELKWIGITRQEIPSFVKKLICERN